MTSLRASADTMKAPNRGDKPSAFARSASADRRNLGGGWSGLSKPFWAALGAIAVLWPARLAGPLDGAPLDQPSEAVIIGVLLVWMVVTSSPILNRASIKGLIAALLVWKVVTGAVLAQDGWCLRFVSPVPLYLENVTVPHSWDIRADWRSPVPQCSAVMTESYEVLERFPAWFYNLPPMDVGMQASANDRPPNVTPSFTLDGYLYVERPGSFQLLAGEDVKTRVRVDDRPAADDDVQRGMALDAGLHRVAIDGSLVRSHWSLSPLWNGRDVWTETPATMSPPSSLDRWIRPWGRAVPPLLILAVVCIGLVEIVQRVRSPILLGAAAALSAATVLAALSGRDALMRVAPLLLLGALALPIPRRAQNRMSLSLLVALPFLAMVVTMGIPTVGIFTWYSSGDDWWMFQRFAYRIFMQGYWLEGGQRTFWFQPLYRWIVGSLHLVFGDSSVGELFWDAGAALICASFAFHVAKRFAGFRWGFVAAVATIVVLTLGPAWYLLGRGLSEFSSAGMIHGAALIALRARHGRWQAAIVAGSLATLGFFTRLNNLPMALAVAVFALPVRQSVGDLFHPTRWWRRASRPVVAAVWMSLAIGLWLFTARTWYYTKVPSMFWGTSAGLQSVWQASDSAGRAVARIVSSVLALLTMNDPARFDARALPLVAGFASAIAGVAGIRGFSRLPLTLVVFCLAGVSGALVATANAYPGRFSIHVIPVTTALSVCALSVAVARWSGQRSAPSGSTRAIGPDVRDQFTNRKAGRQTR
jgi:hypothetical protein